jgi:hypothetical protein
MSNPSIGQRVLADFAFYALRFKLIEAAKVVSWADELIADSKSPPPWMVDLSLVDKSDPHATLVLLRQVPGEPNLEESLDLLNGLVLREWRNGRLTIGEVRGIGWVLYMDNVERPDSSKWGVVVECKGEEMDNGYLSEAQLRDVIDNQLARFEPELRRLPDWA